MDTRLPIDARATGLMVLLCFLWGLQQVAIKAITADVAPVLQIALRSGVAALLVAALMALRGERLVWNGGNWRPGIIVGILFALEFLLVGEGLRHTTASHMVVFLYTAPIFAALGLHWKLVAERLRPAQWAGVALAFAGIVTTFQGRGVSAGGGMSLESLWGDFLGLMAGMSWGMTTIVIRCSRLSRASAKETLLYQLLGACVLLGISAPVLGQTGFHLTPLAWASLIFQTLIISFASYFAWFWLLTKYLASRLGVLAFMTPLFGIALGVWLLAEPLELKFLIGAGLVLGGILTVQLARENKQ